MYLRFLQPYFALQKQGADIRFVFNHGDYTVERLIHGKEAFYNEVAIYDYLLLAKPFGPAYNTKYYGLVSTGGQLSELLEDPAFGNATCLEVSLSSLSG